jgi:hypothetical protein
MTRLKKHRRWLLALLFLLVVGGLGWAVRPDPTVARAKALQAELFADRPAGPPSAETKAKMDEFRTLTKTMSDSQRADLFAPMREKAKAEFDRYFTLSKKEKTQYLDTLIDQGEKFRKEREKAGKTAAPGTGGPPGGGFRGPAGGGGPDAAKDRGKARLDHSTPEDRAKRDQFRKDMDDRRKQRGLPAAGR